MCSRALENREENMAQKRGANKNLRNRSFF